MQPSETETDPWLRLSKETEASILQLHGTEFSQHDKLGNKLLLRASSKGHSPANTLIQSNETCVGKICYSIERALR